MPFTKKIEPKSAIEDVDSKRLQDLINNEEFLACFFYTKGCKDCETILRELEKIDDDAKNFGLQFVKNGEKFVAKQWGVVELPALVYFRNKEPIVYNGDLTREDSVLRWLTNRESLELADVIEEVNAKVLQNVIDENEFVAVLFYKNNTDESRRVIDELEEIDDDAARAGIALMKTSDEVLAVEFGLESLPAFLYYRNKIPLLYDGDLHNKKQVLQFLEKHKDLDADVIEDVTGSMLATLIKNATHLAVLFYEKSNENNLQVLSVLEEIDDDASQHGIPFVKISNKDLSASYGIKDLPSLVFFKNNIPNFYQGNLQQPKAAEEVLNFLIHQKESDEIEDVTNKVLSKMIKTMHHLAVLFYDSGSSPSQLALRELEGIDDDCDQNSIPFVKIDDSQIESIYGIKSPPALIFYKNQVPKFYSGDFKESDVLKWLLEEKDIERIEDISAPVLNQMIKNTDFLSVLFYDKSDETAKKAIKELEKIVGETNKKNLPFAKIDDSELAKTYGIDDELPVLVYFEDLIPSIYRDDLMNTKEVLKYLTQQIFFCEIKEVSSKLLDTIIKKYKQVAVIFYDSSSHNQFLEEVEQICEDVHKRKIVFLKSSDLAGPEKFGIEYLPSLVFFDETVPYVYSGNIADKDLIFEYLVGQLARTEIRDVNEKILLDLIEVTPSVVAIFYDPNIPTSSLVMKAIQNIDGHIKDFGISFVKVSDFSVASTFGVGDELPAIIYFKNRIPSIFDGDEFNASSISEWITLQTSEDNIEDVSEEILLNLIRDEGYVLVFFAPAECTVCESILAKLEIVDDEADKRGILFVTTQDMTVAIDKASVTEFPALILFRNEEPVQFKGDLLDEHKVMEWITNKETLESADAIEELNHKMLENFLNASHSVAVLFYKKKDCPMCEKVLTSLEIIDDDAEENDVDFVKVSDSKAALAYDITEFPSLVFFRRRSSLPYTGDLLKSGEILQWLIENRDRPDSFIEDVDRRELEVMIEERTVAVFFYDENCTTCDSILQNIENIDDDSDRFGVQVLKTDDTAFAAELGVTAVPSFVYFENMIPSIYDGDIMNENDLLQWLVEQKTTDTIENINREMLFRMIEEQEYLAIYFYKENDKESKDILKHLEQIDDDCSDYEVQLLKMSDGLMAKKYRVRNPPGLVFFRHGNPITYPGDLMDEEEVLDFLTSPENMESSDSIEKVNRRMLERVLAKSDYLAVFFYRKNHCRKCTKTLEVLENIDTEAEKESIHFVKIEDEKLARSYGVFSVPSLVFFRFGDVDDPVIYAGDMKNGSNILDFLITQKDPASDMIEEMDGEDLEDLIETADYLAVLFYDPDEDDCPQCKEALEDLENIDDDTDRHGILFVKTTDDSIAADYGLTHFPALIYFENNVPSIYEGDISAEEEVLQFLIQSKSEDTIETVNNNICDKLIEDTPYLVVIFYKYMNKFSENVLEHLENLDGIADENGIQMVKIQDSRVSKRYGIKQIPAMVFFRNERPMVYQGDLRNEEEVINWILNDKTILLPNNIEEITGKMLEKMVEKYQLLAVFFYEEEECDTCQDIISVLEEIDEEADLFGIRLVKVMDANAFARWEVQTLPALGYFRKQALVFYEGSLHDGEGILNWLTSQDMMHSHNEIEDVSRKMLDKLLQENDFLAILFYDSGRPACDEALRALEDIDDDIDELDIIFVKIQDARYARRYGVKEMPSLNLFRKKFPTAFRGNLTNTVEVLNWLKKNRYRTRELNLFMFSILAMGVIFIQYTFFLKFCFAPMVQKQS